MSLTGRTLDLFEGFFCASQDREKAYKEPPTMPERKE